MADAPNVVQQRSEGCCGPGTLSPPTPGVRARLQMVRFLVKIGGFAPGPKNVATVLGDDFVLMQAVRSYRNLRHTST